MELVDRVIAELETRAERVSFVDALTRVLAGRRTELEAAPTLGLRVQDRGR